MLYLSKTPIREKGAVLAIGLLILVIMTLLSVTAMTTTGLENKMAGNLADWNLALQAAEAGLRDAELDIATKNRVSGLTNAVVGCATTGGSNPDQDGQCLPAPTDTVHIWQLVDFKDTAAPIKYVKYGNKTGATGYTAAQGYVTVPRYIIEPKKDTGIPGRSIEFGAPTKHFRVTDVGYGGTVDGSVNLQSTYALP